MEDLGATSMAMRSASAAMCAPPERINHHHLVPQPAPLELGRRPSPCSTHSEALARELFPHEVPQPEAQQTPSEWLQVGPQVPRLSGSSILGVSVETRHNTSAPVVYNRVGPSALGLEGGSGLVQNGCIMHEHQVGLTTPGLPGAGPPMLAGGVGHEYQVPLPPLGVPGGRIPMVTGGMAHEHQVPLPPLGVPGAAVPMAAGGMAHEHQVPLPPPGMPGGSVSLLGGVTPPGPLAPQELIMQPHVGVPWISVPSMGSVVPPVGMVWNSASQLLVPQPVAMPGFGIHASELMAPVGLTSHVAMMQAMQSHIPYMGVNGGAEYYYGDGTDMGLCVYVDGDGSQPQTPRRTAKALLAHYRVNIPENLSQLQPICTHRTKSGFLGVYPARKGRWQAQVNHRSIGGYSTAWDAGVAVTRHLVMLAQEEGSDPSEDTINDTVSASG